MRIWFDGNNDALDKMSKKHKHAKDIRGLGSGVGECSTSKNVPHNGILFVSWNGDNKDQTFIVRNAPRKKVDLTITNEDMKLRINTGIARRSNNTNPKGKGKMGEGSFTRSKNMRRQQRRPPISRRQGNSTTHKKNKVWEKKRMDERTVEGEHPRIHPRRS